VTGIYAEDSIPTKEKVEKAEELFEYWWLPFGRRVFEEELDIKVTRREIMSYAFIAGYIAGYNKAEVL